jgi:hypothetical protein
MLLRAKKIFNSIRWLYVLAARSSTGRPLLVGTG